jgi:hypothetical protein
VAVNPTDSKAGLANRDSPELSDKQIWLDCR